MKNILTFIVSLFIGISVLGCENRNAGKNDSIAESPVGTDSDSIVKPVMQEPEKNMSFAFVGDIMMGTTYPDSGNYLPVNDGAEIFKDAIPILSSVDFAAGNLEGTLLDGKGTVKKCSNPSICYAFRMPTRYADHLVNAGFDFVGIANNHINDFGAEGLSSTQQTLKDKGLLFAGLRATCPTTSTVINGKKIGIAAFATNMGTPSILDFEEAKKNIGQLREENDIVIVSFHGGGEGPNYTHVPHATETCFGENRGNVEAFAHAAIDAGADIVYGHGPHVTRALELYNDHLIIYSLGNFCTPYRVNVSGINGHAPIVTVNLNPDGTFESGKIHSFIQTRGIGPRIDETNSVAKNMKSLSFSDFPDSPLLIADDGTLSKK